MNDITNIFRQLSLVAIAMGTLMGLLSCDNLIYDEEGDCEVTYRLRFRYDKNLKWADAFANEVKSVHLYAFDTDGNLVWETTDKGKHLETEDYSIKLPLPAGEYKFIAWCGTDNDTQEDPLRGESFSLTSGETNNVRYEDLLCSLNRKYDSEHQAYSDEKLYSLFHGTLDATLPASDNGEDYIYTMHLTKDTNHIRIILQHLSGEDVDAKDFTFYIDDANGLLDYNNSILDDEVIRYYPWSKMNSTAGVGKPDIAGSRAIIQVSGAIVDLTVNRLSPAHRNSMMLTIKNRSGKTVAHVPLIDYALLSKQYYEEAYGHIMTDQEFLDREDEYVFTFFLDQDREWISSSILIHSWRIVIQNQDLH